MLSRLDYALALAGLGFNIFPLEKGKKTPFLGESWKAIRTTNPDIIRQWFETRPDCNYAVNPSLSQVVIDLDEGAAKNGRVKQGVVNFDTLESANIDFDEEPLFSGLIIKTPKGGFHGYFIGCKRAYRNSASSLAVDVDVRGNDGYVVGPGSRTDNLPNENTAAGEYTLVTSLDDVKPLPSWLEAKLDAIGIISERDDDASIPIGDLDTDARIKGAKEFLLNRNPAIEGQTGDIQAYMTAIKLRAQGISEEKCFEILTTALIFPPDKEHPKGRSWNHTCVPEWSPEGLATKIHNAYRFGKERPGAEADMLESIGNPDTSYIFEEAGATTQSQESGEDRIRSTLYSGMDAFISRVIDTDMLAPEYIPAIGYTAIKAKRATGKTVFIYDLALRLACDMNWHNEIPLAKNWGVVYLCGEDDAGLQLHMEAWQQTYDKTAAADRLLISTVAPDLMSGQEIALWVKIIKERLGDRRIVVFVDTWQRATSRASQNDDKEMQTAIHNAQALVKALNGPMIIACHPPKSNTDSISGSMVIENHSSAIIHIVDEGLRRRATVERIKGPGEHNFIGLEYKLVELGRTDKFGKQVTGLVPIAKGGTGLSADTSYYRELVAMGQQIGLLIQRQMEENKGYIGIKEAGRWLMDYAVNNPSTSVGKFGSNITEEDEAVYRIRQAFPLGKPIPLEDKTNVNASILADDKKLKLMGVGGERTNGLDI